MTIDGVRPIFVLDDSTVFVHFDGEIASIKLGPDYGFRLPAMGFVNAYFGSTQIIEMEQQKIENCLPDSEVLLGSLSSTIYSQRGTQYGQELKGKACRRKTQRSART